MGSQLIEAIQVRGHNLLRGHNSFEAVHMRSLNMFLCWFKDKFQ